MAWQPELTDMLRYTVGDFTEPYTYSNAQMEKLIVVGAQFVNTEVDLTTDYTISVQGTGITPDPTDPRDDPFINLTILRTACLLASNEAKLRGGQAITVRDIGASVSTADRGKLALQVAESFCENYEEAKLEYQTGQYSDSASRMRAVVSPFRFEEGGNSGRRY
jgi:hypothetical protein